jgi:hypothetical protein
VVKAYPDKFRAYQGIVARYSKIDEFKKNILENPDVYIGAKYLGDYNGVAVDHEILRPFFEFLNEKKMLVLLHTWGKSAFNGEVPVGRLIRMYPDITFVLGHSFHGSWDEGMKFAKECPNIYYEITATHDDNDILKDLVRGVGSDRMLFGTDLPWFSTYIGIGSILAADMTDEDRENIFYKNAMRLMEKHPLLK